jgi:hypothetical protein
MFDMKKNKRMTDYIEKLKLLENGGRRFIVDRRQLSYTIYIPERRSGIDRRCGKDRRKEPRLNSRLCGGNL